ncbi:signal peptidase II [bacterium]|nr:signal peptidase II [bacterium]
MSSMPVKFTLLICIPVLGFWTDMTTKTWAVNHLGAGRSRVLIRGVLELVYTENRGMVFGLFSQHHFILKQVILAGLTFAAICFLFMFIWRIRKRPFVVLLPFFIILSGALPNFSDRIRFGHVVDFIHIHCFNILDWPFLFNVADIFICAGALLLGSMLLFNKNRVAPEIFS